MVNWGICASWIPAGFAQKAKKGFTMRRCISALGKHQLPGLVYLTAIHFAKLEMGSTKKQQQTKKTTKNK